MEFMPSPGCDEVRSSFCGVNCGNRCALLFHMKNGRVHHVETDSQDFNGEGGDLQARACPKGRAIVNQLYDFDARLTKPLKRVGKRGEGSFEPISWNEAFDLVADRLTYIKSNYGNDSIYLAYAAGIYSTTAKPFRRLLSCIGGYLDHYGSYSDGQLGFITPYMFGESDKKIGSTFDQALNSDFILLFGNNLAETYMGGAGNICYINEIRKRAIKCYQVDYRLNDSVEPLGATWIPIEPGTDAALSCAIAWVLISEGLADEEFLHKYCVGYDEATLPESAPKNASFKDYILGKGSDKIAKTPQWAEPICRVSANVIVDIAHELAAAKWPFVCQNYGVQRQSNGELSSLCIIMLQLLTGKVGLAGTHLGTRPAQTGATIPELPACDNPVKAQISFFTWPDAITSGADMTAAQDGVRGVDHLKQPVKAIINYASNTLTNQHGDANRLHEILMDETLCEFILCVDIYMTDSAKYADVILPDITRFEQESLTSNGSSENRLCAFYGEQITDAPFEHYSAFDMCAQIAQRMGCADQFSEGLTESEWMQRIYNETRQKIIKQSDIVMPQYEELKQKGLWKGPRMSRIALQDFIADPINHPLKTPSGKIEIYSCALAKMAKERHCAQGDRIEAIPAYVPVREGRAQTCAEYPLVISGFHDKRLVHSSFYRETTLDVVCPLRFWINPIDAEPRGISNNDQCRIKSPRGKIIMHAFVTNRIIPGVVGIPQGSWRNVIDGVDFGGCINTLTDAIPSPIARANAVHTFIGEVQKQGFSNTEVGK